MRIAHHIRRLIDEYRIRQSIIMEYEIPFMLAERNAEYFMKLIFTWRAEAVVVRGSDKVFFTHIPA